MGCIPLSITLPPCQHPTHGQGGSLTSTEASAQPMGMFLLISQNLLPLSPHPADPWGDTRAEVSVEQKQCFPPGWQGAKISLQVNKYLTSASVWGLGFFFNSLKTLGRGHKCQELNYKLQLCSQGGISKVWDSFWVLLSLCDGTLLITHPPTATSPHPQSGDTSLLCQSGQEGLLCGLGKIWVCMGVQICVVRPVFLLCWVYAFNQYIFFS